MNREMVKALEADGKKLRQLTGEDHGPTFIFETENPAMKWISESEALPPIAQTVLLAHPRQAGEFWDITTARLLVRYEGVVPRPVPKGSRWPAEYWWEANRGGSAQSYPFLVSGNSWWALLDDIPLPPGAEHRTESGQHYIVQPELVFVPQGAPVSR
jgi:hypothetical protein